VKISPQILREKNDHMRVYSKKGECRKMKKILTTAVVFIVVFSMFSVLTPHAMGWAGWLAAEGLHSKMTRDALRDFQAIGDWSLTHSEIESIAYHADLQDWISPHPQDSCHRVRKYQYEFEYYGGTFCIWPGAEFHARQYIEDARLCYERGDFEGGQIYLGRAIHYIQDALCPPHVFPFSEKWWFNVPPHSEFELYTNEEYEFKDWPLLIRNAPLQIIASPEDLQYRIVEAADLVRNFNCSYVRQDGEVIGDPWSPWYPLPPQDWHMSDSYIGKCMVIAAQIVKGATIWARWGILPADLVIETSGPLGVLPGDILEYMIMFSNAQAGTTENVVVKDKLPEGVIFEKASDGGIYDGATRTVTWYVDPFVPAGFSGFFELKVSVPNSTPIGTVLENIATITTSSLEYPLHNNQHVTQTIVSWADVSVAMYAPNSVLSGSTLRYVIYYFNLDGGTARNVIIADQLPSQVDFITASAGGVYDSITHRVNWNIGALKGFTSDSLELTVYVPKPVPSGSLLQNTVEIATISHESNYDNNQYQTDTTTLASLQIEISPILGWIKGTPILGRGRITSFTYHGDWSVTGVTLRIHQYEGLDITTTMTRVTGTYDWRSTYVFLEAGWGEVFCTVYYSTGSQVITCQIVVRAFYDPSGCVYDELTGARIQGATVTLFRFDTASRGFIEIPSDDPCIYPNINPQTTDFIGEYEWMVSSGIYMVKAEKQGYASNFALVSVPPPATDVNIPLMPVDMTPPATSISFREPSYVDSSENTHLTSATLVTLMAEDNMGGSGVALTAYEIYNASYDSGWITYSEPFYLTGLSDGTYYIDFNSTDNAGNVEPTKTVTVMLDNTPPSTTIIVGEPKYTSDMIYVTTETPFTLEADDGIGSSVYSIAYRIYNISYDSGWLSYTGPFYLAELTDGVYTIEFNSTDNLGNMETTKSIQITLFSWNYVFTDSYGRGTTLKINLAHKFFQFITPDKDYGIRNATYMRIYNRAIIVRHKDNELKLATVFVDTKLDFCIAYAKDIQTGQEYWLIDKVGTEN
jgi:uncharacterized repeat protein (TIGR01451 family)